jgi:SAM-dependent methyltransferase
VPSRSARISSERPFYTTHADAYDALITDPVEPWVTEVDTRLRRARHESAYVLDAGCGTGRHASALAARGHRVALLDASAPLVEIARRRCPGAEHWVADICAPGLDRAFDAIACRGVLNDLVQDDEREAALRSLSALCARGALLLLDVREASASSRRADGRPSRREAALADGRTLVFTSRSTWADDCILVDEEYELTQADGSSAVHHYAFEMRPWSRKELSRRLTASGFTDLELLPGVGRRTTDRLLVAARRA